MMFREDPLTLVSQLPNEDAGLESIECRMEHIRDELDRVFIWENSRFTVKLTSGPSSFRAKPCVADGGSREWSDYVPSLKCESKCTPFRLLVRCTSGLDESEKPILSVVPAANYGMYYAPEEIAEAVRVIAEEALHAAEACKYMESQVKELYPGARLYDAREQHVLDPGGVAGSFDEFQLVDEARGEGWSRMVWRNTRFLVGFHEPGEGLLHIDYHKVDPDEMCPTPQVVARPQLIGADLEPLLLVDLAPVMWRVGTAGQDMDRLVAEAGVAEKLCRFMRLQVARHYPQYVL